MSRRRGPDVPSLVAGITVLAFGAILLGDQLDAFDLRFAALAPIGCAIIGAILLATGLTRRD
jgi:hypothetical protein